MGLTLSHALPKEGSSEGSEPAVLLKEMRVVQVNMASSIRDGFKDWVSDIRRIPQLIKERAFKRRTKEEMFESAQYSSVNPMRRVRTSFAIGNFHDSNQYYSTERVDLLRKRHAEVSTPYKSFRFWQLKGQFCSADFFHEVLLSCCRNGQLNIALLLSELLSYGIALAMLI